MHFYKSKVIFYRDVKSTFNLPAINNGDTPLGVNTLALVGQYTRGSIPNIKGHISTAGSYGAETFTSNDIDAGAFWISNQSGWRYNTSNSSVGKYSDLHFDASRISGLYQNDETFVKSCGTYMYYIIKF